MVSAHLSTQTRLHCLDRLARLVEPYVADGAFCSAPSRGCASRIKHVQRRVHCRRSRMPIARPCCRKSVPPSCSLRAALSLPSLHSESIKHPLTRGSFRRSRVRAFTSSGVTVLPVSLLTTVCASSHKRDTGFNVLFPLDVVLRHCSAHACQAVDITTAHFASASKALTALHPQLHAPSSRALSCDGQRLSPQSRR